MPETKPTPAQERAQTTWVNKTVTEYPGADGTAKHPEPGDVITDAKDGWPPKWVVDQGCVVEDGTVEAEHLKVARAKKGGNN